MNSSIRFKGVALIITIIVLVGVFLVPASTVAAQGSRTQLVCVRFDLDLQNFGPAPVRGTVAAGEWMPIPGTGQWVPRGNLDRQHVALGPGASTRVSLTIVMPRGHAVGLGLPPWIGVTGVNASDIDCPEGTVRVQLPPNTLAFWEGNPLSPTFDQRLNIGAADPFVAFCRDGQLQVYSATTGFAGQIPLSAVQAFDPAGQSAEIGNGLWVGRSNDTLTLVGPDDFMVEFMLTECLARNAAYAAP